MRDYEEWTTIPKATWKNWKTQEKMFKKKDNDDCCSEIKQAVSTINHLVCVQCITQEDGYLFS